MYLVVAAQSVVVALHVAVAQSAVTTQCVVVALAAAHETAAAADWRLACQHPHHQTLRSQTQEASTCHKHNHTSIPLQDCQNSAGPPLKPRLQTYFTAFFTLWELHTAITLFVIIFPRGCTELPDHLLSLVGSENSLSIPCLWPPC